MCEKTAETAEQALRSELKKTARLSLTCGILVGLVFAVLAYSAGKASNPSKPEAPVASADVAALKAQVAELAQFKTEASQVILSLAKRADDIAGNHNRLVEGVQRVTNQQGYDVSLVSRALRNYVGKDKWEKCVKTADDEFKAEVEKAKADAEKAAKEAADKAKAEPVKAPEAIKK